MGLLLLQKRASDLLDAYLGGTGRNIADAFAEARDMHAFLVFDEADSLLLERADAVRSWEISQVSQITENLRAAGHQPKPEVMDDFGIDHPIPGHDLDRVVRGLRSLHRARQIRGSNFNDFRIFARAYLNELVVRRRTDGRRKTWSRK
jgi:SpoVK/Ycf46/Vps4 family AAA+-type ATPase